MSSLNKVQIIGNLGRDPELKTFSNGGKLCNLRIAASETWKDKNTGERKERTEWISVVIHSDRTAEIAEKYLRKGSKVYIEGQLETRKWQDQSGQDRYTTEVAVRPFKGEIKFLGGKDGRSDQGGSGGYGGGSYDQGQGYGGDYRGPNDLDDEIPF